MPYVVTSGPKLYGHTPSSSDTTPDAFTFTDVTGATISTVYTSNTITVAGINASTAISITGGTYSKNGGSYTSSAGTVVNGDTVAVRGTSSSSSGTAVNVVLTIGGVSDTYTVTTSGASPYSTVRRGTNIGSKNYYDPGQNFLNIIRDSGSSWRDSASPGTYSSYVSRLGWPTNVPAGASIALLVKGDMSPTAGDFKSGIWRVICSNSNFTIKLRNGTTTGSVLASGSSAITWNAPGGASTYFWLELLNSSGSTQSVTPGRTGLAMYHSDYDAQWAAGDEFDPLLVTSLAGEALLRFMDTSGGIGGVANASDMPANKGEYLLGIWPPDICANLAKKVGCGAYYCAPYIRDHVNWTSDAAANTFSVTNQDGSTTVPFVNGDYVSLAVWDGVTSAFSGMDHGGYYVVNRTGTTFQVALTAGGAAIDLTASHNDGTSPGWLRNVTRIVDPYPTLATWTARFAAEYPACPEFILEMFNELWNSGFPTYGWTTALLPWFAFGVRTGPVSDQWNMAIKVHNARLWNISETYYPRPVSRRWYTSFVFGGGQFENTYTTNIPTGEPFAGQKMYQVMDKVSIAPYTPTGSLQDLYDAGFIGMTDAARRTYLKTTHIDDVRINALKVWQDKLAAYGASSVGLATYEMNQSITSLQPTGDATYATEDAFVGYVFGSGGAGYRADLVAMFEEYGVDNYLQYTNTGKITSHRGGFFEHWGEVQKAGDTNAYRDWRIATFRPLGA